MLASARRFWNLPRPAGVVVRCAARTHRVRLAPGRFWAAARCPVCRSTVDRYRIRRVGGWLARLVHPAAPRRLPRLLWMSTVAYLTLAVAAAASIWLLADRWWVATVLLFGPRWVLALPLAFLIPGALVADRPLLAPLLVAALVALGPVIGLHTGWRRLLVAPDAVRDLRVMTFNTEGGHGLAWDPKGVLDGLGVDIAALQECGAAIAERITALPGWYTDARDDACLISRFPILAIDQMDREMFRDAQGSGLVVTYRLDVDGREVLLTNLHLETPRAGLEAIRSGDVLAGAPLLSGRSLYRGFEHRFAHQWVEALRGPRLVVGDFNSPPESPMFRSYWGDWQNAFNLVGVGLGGTRLDGWIRARIDHILADEHWIIVRSSLGPHLGSDHAPLLADVRLR
jgi:endonuclease/exonuclease/phosphatase (EEP) superfamily protein YafD